MGEGKRVVKRCLSTVLRSSPRTLRLFSATSAI